MPSYLTTEEFACGHTHKTVHRPGIPEYLGMETEARSLQERDTRVINEVVPLEIGCLTCVCQSILDVSIVSPEAIPQRYLRDLNSHIHILKQSASKVMQRELQLLEEQVRHPDDIDEFRKGVLSLVGYGEISACFGL
ncbi:hypothetical protein GQX73_g5899 [Xylaria multiplex]|uniref:Uncharacterized protein n=1 Tax=Xylaria multiplex TaxID=323545 RepID=A0A7C8IVX7_9PEZI|nr:hypothetical protein GQX73_g5899 [Xylaria multiplex]